MRRLSELAGILTEEPLWIGTEEGFAWFRKEKKRVHLFALGDVGSILLTGLVLLGADCISEIGLYDVREHAADRFEFEMGQVRDGAGRLAAVPVRVIGEAELFDCDVFLFCASLRVPPVSEGGDVRMAQFAANAVLVRETARKASSAGFSGLFGVVSDPVDPLCRAVREAGLAAAQIKGFGLGVMHARACYFAGKDHRYSLYLSEGRAFGPHGADLVIADSLENYCDERSRQLTALAAEANLQMRAWGFKPYFAPALSSGALSVLAMLRGDWHYSSQALGEVWFGARNRVTPQGIEVENPELPEALFARCRAAYDTLAGLGT